MRILIAAALLAAAPVFAGEITGTVAAVDTVRNTMTLTDKTVWMLPAEVMPQDAMPGDKVRVHYVPNADNGWGKIVKVELTRS